MLATLIWTRRGVGSSCQTGKIAALLISLFFVFDLLLYNIIKWPYQHKHSKSVQFNEPVEHSLKCNYERCNKCGLSWETLVYNSVSLGVSGYFVNALLWTECMLYIHV